MHPPFTAAPGETLLIPLPNGPAIHHLHVIVTHREKNTNKVILVGLSSYENGNDPTVLLNVGDHPFIKHKTYVNYLNARVSTTDKLIELVARQMAFPKEPCSIGLLETIRLGIMKSRYTPKGVKEFYQGVAWPL